MSGTEIAFVTDSSSDLASVLALRPRIELIPKATAPSAESFAEAYHTYLSTPPNEILVLCGPGSATNATLAKNDIDRPVQVGFAALAASRA